jgi:hypothetical protein
VGQLLVMGLAPVQCPPPPAHHSPAPWQQQQRHLLLPSCSVLECYELQKLGLQTGVCDLHALAYWSRWGLWQLLLGIVLGDLQLPCYVGWALHPSSSQLLSGCLRL